MANSRIYLKSEAGGTTVLSRDTTANSGNLVLPASGNVASVDTVVTDNAIARFDSTTGKLQNSSVTIDDSGNIGIGTGSPATALNVNTASETKCGLYLQKNLSSVALLGAESTWLGAGTSNNAVLAAYGTNSLILCTNAAERMRIDTAGNVGIGDSTPQYKLSIGQSISLPSTAGSKITAFSKYTYVGNASFLRFSTVRTLAGSTHNSTEERIQKVVDVTEMGYIGFGDNNVKLGNGSGDKVVIDGPGNLQLTSGTGALGYGTGSGGTVTQATSKSTSVTLNKPTGQITMNNAALAPGVSVGFYVHNSLVSNTDVVYAKGVFTGGANPENYQIDTSIVQDGDVKITVKNISAITLSESVQIQFLIIRGAVA